jgi:hypothetical protein
MIFPRPWIKLKNGCFVLIFLIGKKKGKPIKSYRPQVWYKNDKWQCSRLSYHLNKSSIPRRPDETKNDSLVLHTCDHHWCINPNHLYRGNRKQNARDMYNRHPTIRRMRSNAAKQAIWTDERRKNKALSMIGNCNAKGHKLPIETKQLIARKLKGNLNAAGHVVSAKARKQISETKRQRRENAY